jgi:hypothetical protein
MNKETLRMQMLAGLITESQYKQKLNEESTNIEDLDIMSFLNSNKTELINKLAQHFSWDVDDIEEMSEEEIVSGADENGNEDEEIVGLGLTGLDFSFKPEKVRDTYGDASNFKLVIAGKPVYGIVYNM